MARKKSGKHSKTPAATSATARRSSIAFGAATAVVGASLALGVTPAFAQTGAAGAPAPASKTDVKQGEKPVVKPSEKTNEKETPKQADKNKDAQAKKTEWGGYPPRSLPLLATLLVMAA